MYFFIICNLKILTFQIWQKMLEADFIQFHTSSLERTLIILSTYFYNSQIQVSCANYSFRTHFPSLFQIASFLECQNHQFQQFQHTSLKKSARICLKKNSAMRFQNLGDRFSLLGLIMIFYWSSSNHWNSNVLKNFW